MTLCNQYDGEWELLLLGTLDPETATAMRTHVESGCPDCGERWAEASRLIAVLMAATDSVEPPLRVEERLRRCLLDVSADTAPTPLIQRERRTPIWKPASAAAILAILAAGGWLVLQNANLRRRLAEAQRQLESTPATAVAPAPLQVASPTPPTPDLAAGPASPPAPRPGEAVSVARWERERAQLEESKTNEESARAAAQAELAHLRVTQQQVDARAEAAAAGLEAQRRRAEELAKTAEHLTAELRRLEAEELRQASEARKYAALLQSALDDRSTRVALRAVDPLAGQATASAILSPEGRLLLFARGLPPLPSDKCYQLWVIRQDNPAIVSGGVVRVSSQGEVMHSTRIDGPASRITGFAITDEPLGGSVASRGRKLLFGSVQQR